MESTHAVVEFTQEHAVAVVPVCWLDNSDCYWPPYTAQTAVDKAVKEAQQPKASWNKYPVRVMFLSCKYI